MQFRHRPENVLAFILIMASLLVACDPKESGEKQRAQATRKRGLAVVPALGIRG